MIQIKTVQNWISYKKLTECKCLSPLGVELGSSKDCYVWNIIVYGNGKVEYCKKMNITSKNELKVVEKQIFHKNVTGHIYLSPPGMELEGSKDWYVWNIITGK